ncbi:MAG: C40 family peptidase [Calditrichaceae bacterium]|nr:C40 family peptidase [Calditrichaceae bacterium]MBN2709231.1 C40 family peptidase [Calditrichaceae bacterium]RQV96184.1 MAG: NlpC/P60 family protein [Calditrichota bacterium]
MYKKRSYYLLSTVLFLILTISAGQVFLNSCTSAVRFSAAKKRVSQVSDPIPVKADKTSVKKEGRLWQEASIWVGTPYRYGGTDRAGIDCSGLVGYLFREVYGIDLPRTVSAMLKEGRGIGGKNYREGDLLFFKNSNRGPVDHVGIYLGDQQFIHASTSSGVIIDRLDDDFYRKRLITARRYLPR